jgi:renal tumor antigen
LTDGYYNYKMDMWGVGCVFFEIVSLFPLFPGTNELDQIQKIHNIIGTPSAELLGKMKQRSAHMDFNFPQKSGSGIEKLIPHATPECIDLINKLLAYNPDDRLSARQALRHPYFREIREMEKRQYALMNPKADGTLSGSGGDDSRKGHHGSAVTSSDARSDRTRRSRASASVASTSVPSIAGKGIGEGIGGYEPGGGHRRSQPGGSHRSHGGAASSVHSGYHAGASSYHGGSDASSIISAGGISLGGVSAARSGGYGSGAAELGVQGVGGGRNVKPVGGAREPVKLGGGYGGVAGSSYGGSYKRESKPGARGSRLEPPSGVGGHKAPVSHRSDKYVSPYGQQRR